MRRQTLSLAPPQLRLSAQRRFLCQMSVMPSKRPKSGGTKEKLRLKPALGVALALELFSLSRRIPTKKTNLALERSLQAAQARSRRPRLEDHDDSTTSRFLMNTCILIFPLFSLSHFLHPVLILLLPRFSLLVNPVLSPSPISLSSHPTLPALPIHVEYPHSKYLFSCGHSVAIALAFSYLPPALLRCNFFLSASMFHIPCIIISNPCLLLRVILSHSAFVIHMYSISIVNAMAVSPFGC